MAEGQKAEFNFVDFKAVKFSLDYTKDNDQSLAISLIPYGEYAESSADFKLRFEFVAYQEAVGIESPLIASEIQANFKFSDGILFSDIPDYFYRNAIAIAYPYLRSFISTLTLQANAGLLVIPVMNLTNMEGVFRQNSKKIE